MLQYLPLGTNMPRGTYDTEKRYLLVEQKGGCSWIKVSAEGDLVEPLALNDSLQSFHGLCTCGAWMCLRHARVP